MPLVVVAVAIKAMVVLVESAAVAEEQVKQHRLQTHQMVLVAVPQ
tara:strand:- start:147 stop:281 length:135 start_codon:yes stop_codon:yes gene_type:complete